MTASRPRRLPAPWIVAAFVVTAAVAVAARIGAPAHAAASWSWVVVGAVVVTGIAVWYALRGAAIELEAARVELAGRETRLALVEARLEEHGRAQGRFVGNIAHELQTPLTVVLSQVDLLLENAEDPVPTKRYALSIRDDVRHVSDLVNSFLRLARPFAHADTSQHVPVFFHDVVVEAVHRSQPLANDAGVTVVTTLAELGDPDGALEVMGDPVLLEAMVENLVRNAVRFSPRGGKVEVTVLVGAGSETITLRVRDHGAGIAAEDLTAVFDWFFDRPVREQRPTGTGFGLAIAKRVADHHGGTITARNRDAGGCELEVTLPRWCSEAGAGPSGPRQPGAEPGAGTA